MSALEHLPQQLRDRVVLLGHVHDAKAEAITELRAVGDAAIRSKEYDAGTGHDRRSDELVGAGFLMIAIDENEARTDAQQRCAYPFVVAGKVRHVSREFNGGAQQCRGKRIRRDDEYGLAAHVVVWLADRVRGIDATQG
jgi:hypothetical protein